MLNDISLKIYSKYHPSVLEIVSYLLMHDLMGDINSAKQIIYCLPMFNEWNVTYVYEI